MLYSGNYPFVLMDRAVDVHGAMFERYHRDDHNARWFDNRYDAKGTNSDCDVLVGREDLIPALEDFGRIFEDVSCWFHDISIGRSDPRYGTPETLPKTHPNSHAEDSSFGTHMLFLHGTRA